MKLIFAVLFSPILIFAQVNLNNSISDRLKPESVLPEKILDGRTVVFYDPGLSALEIQSIHESLVKTGVDAIAYFEADRPLAGYDTETAFLKYFKTREISCLVLIERRDHVYRIWVTVFNGESLIQQGQSAWTADDPSLQEVLRTLYRTALNTFKKKNMLINDSPEVDLTINIITGRRTEAFASDLKVDKLAVQKFGVEELDKELEEIMKTYPYKYALVENSIPELDLKKQGYFYILRFVHTRPPAARSLLGYDVSKSQTAVASIVYLNEMVQVKTIPSEVPIFKFYTRQIEFNNVFLGTKWDADTTWQSALVNFISGLKKEMGVN